MWTAFALLVAVAISLLLGHALRITTLAVLAAGSRARRRCRPSSTRSWRVVAAGGALAFAGAAALLVADRVAGRGPAAAASAADGRLARRAGAARSPSTASIRRPTDSCARRCRASSFARLPLRGSSRRTRSDPARAWTTIATGVAAGRSRRPRDRDAPRRRGPGQRCAAAAAAGACYPRRDRRRAADAAVGRQPRRATRQDDLGSRRGGRACARPSSTGGRHGRRRRRRHRRHRSRRAAARARRRARRRDRAGRPVRSAAQRVAGDPRSERSAAAASAFAAGCDPRVARRPAAIGRARRDASSASR